MSRRSWPLLLLLATAGTSYAANLGTSQTLRAGALEIKISAPPSVTRQEFYSLKVTYTNKGSKALQLNDPFHCAMLWDVEDVKTGTVPKPAGQTNYGCIGSTAPIKTLELGKSFSGMVNAIISKYPKGEYRITAERLQSLQPFLYLPKGQGKAQQPAFTPQPIRFQIR